MYNNHPGVSPVKHTRMYMRLLAIVLITGRMQAQQFRAGFSAGLVVSDIDGAHTRRGDAFHKLGFTAGVVGNTQIAKKTLFQFEINYIQKGSMQPPDSLNNGYYKIALGYVEIPMLFRRQIFFKMGGKPVNKIDLEIGASYGRMLERKVTSGTNYYLTNTDAYYNTNDISLLLGADYNISKNFLFCFRYSNSVIPVIKRNTLRPGFITYTFNRGNNVVFQFSFKYIIGINGKTTTPRTEIAPEQN